MYVCTIFLCNNFKNTVGGAPLGPLKKKSSVREKNQKNIFQPDPQVLVYNLTEH